MVFTVNCNCTLSTNRSTKKNEVNLHLQSRKKHAQAEQLPVEYGE